MDFPIRNGSFRAEVIKSIHGIDQYGWDTKAASRFSARTLGEIFLKLCSAFRHYMKVEVANSGRANFWYGRWSEFIPAGRNFHRFLLSTRKDGKIVDFGGIDSHSVDRNLHLRRALRDEETVELQQLVGILSSVVGCPTSLMEESWGRKR